MLADPHDVLPAGPWEHRLISANGARFHVAEAGDGPMLVLLHTVGQFWWAWREQVTAAADAGFHVVAMDLRGIAGSDKPPSGYDLATLTADVAGVIRTLGADDAFIVGHGTGGAVAWSMPGLQPRVTRAIGALSAAHPISWRHRRLQAQRWTADQRARSAHTSGIGRRALSPGLVGATISRGWGVGQPSPEMLEVYRRAMALPSVPQSTAAYRRVMPRLWPSTVPQTVRRNLTSRLRRPITVPVLQMHGSRDPWIAMSAMTDSRTRVLGPLTAHVIPDAGHYLPEEAPTAVTANLLEWLSTVALRPAERRSDDPSRR